MSSTVYFDGLGSLVGANNIASADRGFLRKNALLLIEGRHKSNDGRIHELPASLIDEYIQNTNKAMDEGYELPLMLDHSKTLIHKDGSIAKIGEVIGDISGRIITEKDLPNPKMRHLIGKYGAFGKVEIRDRIPEVESKQIRLLSPGLDLEKKRFIEASAVAFPSIHGPAIFNSALDYADQREQTEAFGETRQQLTSRFNDLCSVLSNIEQADDEQTFGNDKNAMRRKAIDDFRDDLLKTLDLDEVQEPNPATIYNPDPYAQQLVTPRANYSGHELKRRRRTLQRNGK